MDSGSCKRPAKAPKMDTAHNPSTKPKSSPKLPDGVNSEGRCRFQRFFTSRHIDNFKTNGAAVPTTSSMKERTVLSKTETGRVFQTTIVGDQFTYNAGFMETNKSLKATTILKPGGKANRRKGRVLDKLVVGLKPGGNMTKASSWREFAHVYRPSSLFNPHHNHFGVSYTRCYGIGSSEKACVSNDNRFNYCRGLRSII
uniref:Retrotransposon protein n=1 Tax=Rhabditophanes sp. KR3021 TaxID=114890 RepID=A0AC35U185_9BILA